MPNMEFSGVMLITNRLDACADFYRVLLDTEPERGAGWVHYRLADGRMLALHTPWDPSMTAEGGSSVTLLEVASLDEEVARLQGTMIAVSEPHDIPGGRVITTSDPDGRLVQLMEHDVT
jgi:predicted enzyme related to lactoylglutathione lyase